MYVCTHVCPYEGMSVGRIDCLTENMIIHEKMYVRMSKMKVSSLRMNVLGFSRPNGNRKIAIKPVVNLPR